MTDTQKGRQSDGVRYEKEFFTACEETLTCVPWNERIEIVAKMRHPLVANLLSYDNRTAGSFGIEMILFKHNFVNEFSKRHKILHFLKRFTKISKFKIYDPREKALNHFDDFYKAVFTHRWPSIRLALLSKQKYVAVLNNFGNIESTEEFLVNEGAFNLSNFLEAQGESKISNVESTLQSEESVKLEEVIQEQAKQEDIKSISELHPEGVEFLSKTESLSEENSAENKGVVTYRPEDSSSPLHADLLTAQIDRSRQIEPDEGVPLSFQEFVPATQLRGLEDYVPESEYYKYYQVNTEKEVTIEKEFDLEFPEKLKVFTFDRGDITEFPNPTLGIHNVFNYTLVEGSNLLTALALGVRPGDKVLDLSPSSGEAALCVFQTLRPKVLICVTDNRKQLENLFGRCLYDNSRSWREMLVITERHLYEYENDEMFDKVLIQVPSTEDRLSVTESEDNVFCGKRVRQRLKLPEFQSTLLQKGLRMVRPGGAVLYSTDTLSPIQNEGVVASALRALWEQKKMDFIVKDLNPALRRFSYFFQFGDFLNMKYGTLIVPFAPINFGPKYFCKIVKKETEQ